MERRGRERERGKMKHKGMESMGWEGGEEKCKGKERKEEKVRMGRKKKLWK